MRRYLDQNIGLWQIERRIGNLRDKHSRDFWIVLEVLNKLFSAWTCSNMPAEFSTFRLDSCHRTRTAFWDGEHTSSERTRYQRKRWSKCGSQTNCENNENYLVISTLVTSNQVLTDSELVRIHHGQQQSTVDRRTQIVFVECRSHGAPNFRALNLCNVSCSLKLHPVSLINLRSWNVQINHLIGERGLPIKKFKSAILSSSRTRVAVSPSLQCALTIVKTRRNILAGIVWTSRISTVFKMTRFKARRTIKKKQSPFLTLYEVHVFLCDESPPASVCDHGVSADTNNGLWDIRSRRHLILRLTSETKNLVVPHSWPELN